LEDRELDGDNVMMNLREISCVNGTGRPDI